MGKGLGRREFLRDSTKFAAGVSLPFLASCGSQKRCMQNQVEHPSEGKMIWANLVHLGYNMWSDREYEGWDASNKSRNTVSKPYVRFDVGLWMDIAKRMSDVGMNMMVIDLGEAVKYKSHPELAAEGAWSHGRMREELNKLRDLGIEPIPKLNFSAGHDAWLKEYNRMLSTKKYYEVCGDLINEVCDLFDGPRFFHMGYDEEGAYNQRRNSMVIVRQHELWWHDFNWFVETIEKNKVRPWMWSDYAWNHPEEFWAKMPKSVLQSNWYYNTEFARYPNGFEDSEVGKKVEAYISTYVRLEEHGFDQVPTGSNWNRRNNFGETVKFCKQHISPERLKGFMQTPWTPTLELFRNHHFQAIDAVGEMIAQWKANNSVKGKC